MKIYSSFVSPYHEPRRPLTNTAIHYKAKKISSDKKYLSGANDAVANSTNNTNRSNQTVNNHTGSDDLVLSRESKNLSSLTSAERQLIIELRNQDKQKNSFKSEIKKANALINYVENSQGFILVHSENDSSSDISDKNPNNEIESYGLPIKASESYDNEKPKAAVIDSNYANVSKLKFAQDIEEIKDNIDLVRHGSYVNIFA